jgi:GNAT superfamily N-acetyltransferase
VGREPVPLEITEIGPDRFALYAQVPIRFLVESVYEVAPVGDGLGGFRLTERRVANPYVKDYDGGGEHRPEAWSVRFDTSSWGIFLATDDNVPVGGATVASGASIYPMDRFQRRDLVVLWDLRVSPDRRGQGIGSAIFQRAADWARTHGGGQLGMETQNTNVGACRFYAKQGCELGAIHRLGYAGCPEVAHEIMLLWYLDLR